MREKQEARERLRNPKSLETQGTHRNLLSSNNGAETEIAGRETYDIGVFATNEDNNLPIDIKLAKQIANDMKIPIGAKQAATP